MSNIALTTLAVLILASPGFVARSAYHSRKFTTLGLSQNWTEDIAKAFFVAIPFHALGIFIIECLHHDYIIRAHVNFETLFRLVSGHYESKTSAMVDSLYQDSTLITLYFICILVCASLLGHSARYIVWEFRLDLRFRAFLEFENPWIYTLLGREFITKEQPTILARVEILTDEPTEVTGKTRLYRGYVSGFTTEKDGELQDILLSWARRGKFEELQGGKPNFKWKRIPGKLFVINYREIKNINIAYLSPSEVAVEEAELDQSEELQEQKQPSDPPSS